MNNSTALSSVTLPLKVTAPTPSASLSPTNSITDILLPSHSYLYDKSPFGGAGLGAGDGTGAACAYSNFFSSF
jgi:hypothetical protein